MTKQEFLLITTIEETRKLQQAALDILRCGIKAKSSLGEMSNKDNLSDAIISILAMSTMLVYEDLCIKLTDDDDDDETLDKMTEKIQEFNNDWKNYTRKEE